MPTPVELVGSSTDTGYESRMSWTFKANLADPPVQNSDSPDFGEVPLKGSWRLGMKTDVQLHLEIMIDGQAKEMWRASWGPEPAPDLIPKTSMTYGGYDLVWISTKSPQLSRGFRHLRDSSRHTA